MNALTSNGAHGKPLRLDLPSLNSPAGETWTLRLDPEILTLARPSMRVVLKLHRDEVARYLRFTHHLLWGRIVAFVLIQGAKKYSFRCTREQQRVLLGWLPEITSSYLTRQAQLACIGVALFGVLHFLISRSLFWVCGAWLILAALLGLILPTRKTFLVNGVLLIMAGLWDLSTGSPMDFRPWSVPPEDRIIPVLAGSLVLMWGIQQISMLGPNHLLRVVRAARDERLSFLPQESGTVRWIGRLNIVATLLFGAYVFAMLLSISLNAGKYAGAGRPPSLEPLVRDCIIFGVLTLLTSFSAIRFLIRKFPAYAEAKVSGQLLVSVAVLSLWGFVSNVNHAQPSTLLNGAVTADPLVFTRPYVWGSLILCVLGFNRWFTHAADRELEEQRD